MFLRTSVLCVFACLCVFAQAPSPNTPAGRTLKAWLDAFNSGDRAQMEAYLKQFDPARPIESQMNLRTQTGGFDLTAIDINERTRVEFRLKSKVGERNAVGKLEVKDAEPAAVVSFGLRPLAAGVTSADLKINAAARQRVIEGALAMLNEYYVFPETAAKMAESIRAKQKAGEYDAITNGSVFAEKLTADLREVSHDRHLGVNFSAAPIYQGTVPGPSASERRRQLESMNCGFGKPEILTHNLGYLKITLFADPAICADTANAAMSALAAADAVIIDLRENNGGDPHMVALLSSYLFDKRTHLNDLFHQKENKTEEFWTSADVPGKRFAQKEVFVLTSARTFSAGEEFAYNLKALKRAVIVGETTGGGAHPVSAHRIDDHFLIGVPYARAINPITKMDWEGTGVVPDVRVPAAEALEKVKWLATLKW